MTTYENLLITSYNNNLLRDFSNPIYKKFKKLSFVLSPTYLTNWRIEELLKPYDESFETKNDKLSFLLKKTIITQEMFDLNNDTTEITKALKLYTYSILDKDDLITKRILSMVNEISNNATLVSKALCMWFQEPTIEKALETDENFINLTLNNQTFFRQWFRGAGESNDFIKNSETWRLVSSKINNLVGIEYCNTVGSLADQYMVNMKMHISSHIKKGIPYFMIRFALNNLKNAFARRESCQNSKSKNDSIY